MIGSKTYKTSFANIETFKFICKESPDFIEEDNPSDKLVTIEEEQDAVEKYGTGNLVDLPGLMFIDSECGNLKVVVCRG